MEIYLYGGIIAKLVQHSEENGQGRQVDMAGRLGPTCHVARGHHGAARCAKWPDHVINPWERLPKPSQALIQCQFAPRVRMERPWITWSTVIHMEAFNQPWNRFTCQISTCAGFTTTFGSQPRPYNQKAVESYAGRRPYHAAQSPSLLHRPSLLPISSPHCL